MTWSLCPGKIATTYSASSPVNKNTGIKERPETDEDSRQTLDSIEGVSASQIERSQLAPADHSKTRNRVEIIWNEAI